MQEEFKYLLDNIYQFPDDSWWYTDYHRILRYLVRINEKDTAQLLNDITDEKDLSLIVSTLHQVKFPFDNAIYRMALVGLKERFKNGQNKIVTQMIDELIDYIDYWTSPEE